MQRDVGGEAHLQDAFCTAASAPSSPLHKACPIGPGMLEGGGDRAHSHSMISMILDPVTIWHYRVLANQLVRHLACAAWHVYRRLPYGLKRPPSPSRDPTSSDSQDSSRVGMEHHYLCFILTATGSSTVTAKGCSGIPRPIPSGGFTVVLPIASDETPDETAPQLIVFEALSGRANGSVLLAAVESD